MDDIFISTGDDLLLGGHDGVILGGDENLLSESESLVGPQGPPGPPGPAGKDGSDGVDGQSASVAVGTTTTGAAGTLASVVNVGTSQNAVFNFTIPQGATGPQGSPGTDGISGVDGFSPIASVEQTEYGAEITITDSNGTTTAQVVNGSQGEPGTPGAAATISVGSTTTGAAGTNASVTNSGTSSAAVLDFVIPRGADGADGVDGQDGVTPVISATASVTGTTGTPAVNVSKTGTDEYPQFNFAFSGLKGESGADWYSCYVSTPQPSGNVSVNGTAYVQNITLGAGTWRLMWGYRLVQQITANSTKYINAGLRNITASADVFMTGINVSSGQDGYIRSMITQSVEVTVSGNTQFASAISNSTLGGTGSITANTCYLYAIKVSN